jgi:hypothetical protein
VKLLSVGEEGSMSSKVPEETVRYPVREGAVRGVVS